MGIRVFSSIVSPNLVNTFFPEQKVALTKELVSKVGVPDVTNNISSVVEFQRWWVLKSKIFAMW